MRGCTQTRGQRAVGQRTRDHLGLSRPARSLRVACMRVRGHHSPSREPREGTGKMHRGHAASPLHAAAPERDVVPTTELPVQPSLVQRLQRLRRQPGAILSLLKEQRVLGLEPSPELVAISMGERLGSDVNPMSGEPGAPAAGRARPKELQPCPRPHVPLLPRLPRCPQSTLCRAS